MATGILTINLDAIKRNWSILKSKVSDTTMCGAVVKADAYGLGAKQVSRSLFAIGCRVFFVATLDEAKTLRDALPVEAKIFVFSGLCQQPHLDGIDASWVDYHLSPVLVTKQHIILWAEHTKSHSLPSCAIKLDTGMHRLGILPQELDDLLLSSDLQELSPEYVMSHFACACDNSHSLNSRQLDTFNRCVQKISQAVPDIKKSMANSSGIFLGSRAHYDLVRPGAALYGVNPTPSTSSPMLPVVTLQLPVMQLKTINKGQSVGYGAEFTAQKLTRIAIIFGGYADGLFRVLGNSGSVFVQNQRLPIIGRVSMDSMAVDLSLLSNSEIENLTFVEVLNEKQTVDDLAAMAGTIGYEILTNLGSRYEKRYVESL